MLFIHRHRHAIKNPFHTPCMAIPCTNSPRPFSQKCFERSKSIDRVGGVVMGLAVALVALRRRRARPALGVRVQQAQVGVAVLSLVQHLLVPPLAPEREVFGAHRARLPQRPPDRERECG